MKKDIFDFIEIEGTDEEMNKKIKEKLKAEIPKRMNTMEEDNMRYVKRLIREKRRKSK